MKACSEAKTIFITPDNCLEKLLGCAEGQDGKVVVMPTGGMQKVILKIRPSDGETAGTASATVLLDNCKDVGECVSLSDIRQRHSKLDLAVAGASVVNRDGLRFGKGHGCFDLEWAVLHQIGVIDLGMPVASLVHDCQVVSDQELCPSPCDTLSDYIATPTQQMQIEPPPKKPMMGVIWEKLEPGSDGECAAVA